MSQAKERAENHWDHYVGPMQRVILEQMVEMCMSIGRFHYISSHIHGVKHAEQDADEVARGALANGAARKARSLCDSCADNHECGIAAVGGRPKTCVEHRPSLCDSCGKVSWCNQGDGKIVAQCSDFAPTVEP